MASTTPPRPTRASRLFDDSRALEGPASPAVTPGRAAAFAVHRAGREHYATTISLARRNLPEASQRPVTITVPGCVADLETRQALAQELARDAGRGGAQPLEDPAVAVLELALMALWHAAGSPDIEHPGYFALLRRQSARILECHGQLLLPSRHGVAVLAPDAVPGALPYSCQGRPELYLAPASRHRRGYETDEDYADRIAGYLVGVGLLRVVAGKVEFSEYLAELGAPTGSPLRSELLEELARGEVREGLFWDPQGSPVSRRLAHAAEKLATRDRAELDEQARVDDLDTVTLLDQSLAMLETRPGELAQELITVTRELVETEPDSELERAAADRLERLCRTVHTEIGVVMSELAEMVAGMSLTSQGDEQVDALTARLHAEQLEAVSEELGPLLAQPPSPLRAQALGMLMLSACMKVRAAVATVVDTEFWEEYLVELESVGLGRVAVPWDA